MRMGVYVCVLSKTVYVKHCSVYDSSLAGGRGQNSADYTEREGKSRCRVDEEGSLGCPASLAPFPGLLRLQF